MDGHQLTIDKLLRCFKVFFVKQVPIRLSFGGNAAMTFSGVNTPIKAGNYKSLIVLKVTKNS